VLWFSEITPLSPGQTILPGLSSFLTAMRKAPDTGQTLGFCPPSVQIAMSGHVWHLRFHWIGHTHSPPTPIPIVWLLVYIVVWMVRWIRSGLRDFEM
jgi:hypothetical protein